jgi:hypothetical protein
MQESRTNRRIWEKTMSAALTILVILCLCLGVVGMFVAAIYVDPAVDWLFDRLFGK